MLTRRELLRLGLISGAGALFGGCGDGSLLPPPAPQSGSILRGRRDEIDDEPLMLIAGEVPRDLEGHALVVGGVPYGDGTPLFTGDGMILRFSFDRGARVSTRLIRTDDFLLDQAVGGMPNLAYRNLNMVRMSNALGARNFANTALVPSRDGRLLATYDAGRPWEIDPLTLEVITPVGLNASYRSMLPALTPGLGLFPIHMTTAHPVWDPDDGRVYVANWAPRFEGLSVESFTRLVIWDGASEPRATAIVDASGAPALLTQSCHQLHTTKRYVVLNDGAFSIEPEQMAGNDITRAQRPSTVLWIVPKAELGGASAATAVRVEIPIESAHFLVERNDDGDRVRVLLMHQNSSDPSEWIRAGDTVFHSGQPVSAANVGMMAQGADLIVQGRYEIDARTGQVIAGSERMLEDDRLWGMTLWTRDERNPDRNFGTAFWTTLGFDPDLLTTRITDVYADHPHRRVPLAELPDTQLPARLLRIDYETMAVLEDLELPSGWVPMSPTFVPRANGGPDEGYLVLLVLGPERDEVWILDASDLRRGPIARLGHPRIDVGFSLHTTWLGDLRSPTPSYRVDRQTDYGAALPMLSPEAREVVRRVLALT